MWHSFSFRYIKENRTASLLLAGTALLASMFLSLLTSLAYNIWMDYKKQAAVKGITQSTPSTLCIVYGIILVLLCIALIAMIHNAFAVSMESRLHQLGILASVGATPKQIYTFLLQEAVFLCIFPILLGTAIGVVFCYGFVAQAIRLGQTLGVNIDYEVSFAYSIGVAVVTLGAALLTIIFSACIPAKKSAVFLLWRQFFMEMSRNLRKCVLFVCMVPCLVSMESWHGNPYIVEEKKCVQPAVFCF